MSDVAEGPNGLKLPMTILVIVASTVGLFLAGMVASLYYWTGNG